MSFSISSAIALYVEKCNKHYINGEIKSDNSISLERICEQIYQKKKKKKFHILVWAFFSGTALKLTPEQIPPYKNNKKNFIHNYATKYTWNGSTSPWYAQLLTMEYSNLFVYLSFLV